jgi:hypothetical protein
MTAIRLVVSSELSTVLPFAAQSQIALRQCGAALADQYGDCWKLR